MLVAAFLALLLIDPLSAIIAPSWWQCGSDEKSRDASYGAVLWDCYEERHLVNNCCLAHDYCYSRQLTQQHCDDLFCQCLLEATGSTPCHDREAPSFCFLVRTMGEDAYKASATPRPKALLPPGDAQHGGESTHL